MHNKTTMSFTDAIIIPMHDRRLRNRSRAPRAKSVLQCWIKSIGNQFEPFPFEARDISETGLLVDGNKEMYGFGESSLFEIALELPDDQLVRFVGAPVRYESTSIGMRISMIDEANISILSKYLELKLGK